MPCARKRSRLDRSQAEVDLLPVDQPLSELTEIRVAVRNLQPTPFEGTLFVAAPEGWKLDEETHSVTLAGEEEAVIPIGIEEAEAKPFHEYVFALTLWNADGDPIRQQAELLEFTLTARAASPIDVHVFGVDDWSHAYPIYLNAPDDPASAAEWKKRNAAAKVYTLWDEQYFYLLVQAYDDAHVNGRTGSAIWNGDNIQISFDTLNDKATSYQDDDYEYGFALTGEKIESYAWQAAAENGRDEAVRVGQCVPR